MNEFDRYSSEDNIKMKSTTHSTTTKSTLQLELLNSINIPGTIELSNLNITSITKTINKHIIRIFSDFSKDNQSIFAYKKHQMYEVKNGKEVFNSLFIRTDISYHRNDGKFNYNGYTQKYKLTKLGEYIFNIITLDNKTPEEIFNKTKELLPKLSKEEATQNIILPVEHIEVFHSIENLNRFNIIGHYKENIIIENQHKSDKFNRTYTTFTLLKKESKKLLENKELFDASKFGLGVLLQSYGYNFNINGTKNKNSNDIKELDELYKYVFDRTYIYALSNFNGENGYNNIIIPTKNIKTACTALSYGAQRRTVIQLLVKGMRSSYKKIIKKYIEKTRIHKLFEQVEKVRDRIRNELDDTVWVELVGAKHKNKKSLLARFCTYFEKQFRKVSDVILEKYSIKHIQCHDAIYTMNKEGHEYIEYIQYLYREVTGFSI
jgi:hypothetical protein